MECIFCDIAKGKEPCHKIWEDKKHLAFLSIYPNTEGFSVVITKKTLSQIRFRRPESVLKGLVIAARNTARKLDTAFADVSRTGMILEGFGVDHLHAKLFPMHGTKMKSWRPIKSNVDKFFAKYEGYISSHDYRRADDRNLARIARKIRSIK